MRTFGGKSGYFFFTKMGGGREKKIPAVRRSGNGFFFGTFYGLDIKKAPPLTGLPVMEAQKNDKQVL